MQRDRQHLNLPHSGVQGTMARTKTTARKSTGSSNAAKAKVAKKTAMTSPGKAPRIKVRYAIYVALHST